MRQINIIETYQKEKKLGSLKNIGMILENPFPSDIRVEKEAEALISAGHSVFLLCPGRKGEAKIEVYNGITINRINLSTSVYSKAFWDVINAIRFSHPVFKKSLKKFTRENQIHTLHVHDLPLAGTAIKYGKKTKLPVIVDLHENYPEAIKVWFQWKKNPIARLKNRLFLNYKKWFKYEKYAVTNCDHIVAVVDEMKNRIISDHGINPDKITVVTNTEKKDFLNQELDTNIYGELADKFIITYTGNVGPHRGVDTAIEGMKYLKDHPDIHFFIVGSVNKNIEDKLQSTIDKYSLSDQVHVLGYRPFEKFYSYMKMATLNLIPHHSNGHTDNTIPHKLFQCMMTKNAVMVSSSDSLKRIVTETNSGLIFEAGNAKDFSEKVIEAYQNRNVLEELGKNGYNETVKKSLNWESTSQILLTLYSKKSW